MAKGKLKSGGRPMYDDDPGCKYVVVENPWPYCGSAASRNESYFRHVGAWLWYASNKTLLPDELFYVSTKNEVVVKYAQHLDITALLGKHDWRQFSLKDNPAENGYSTYIFEFNYGTKGHPDEHQWASQAFEDFSQDAKLQRGALPVRQPYPRPVWADCRDRLRSCRDLALPMPTDIPKPVLPPSEPVSAQPEFTSIYSGLAGRIPERPEQPAALTREGPSDGSNRSGQLYTGKLESEDEEAAALRALKREPRDEELPRVKQESGLAVKSEPYQEPSPEVQASYDAWRKSRETHSAEVKQEPAYQGQSSVKAEPSSNEPSEQMLRLHAEYERSRSAVSSAGQREASRLKCDASLRVKQEHFAATQLSDLVRRSGELPVKAELTELQLTSRPEERNKVTDPRRRDNATASISAGRSFIVKRESDTDDKDHAKRVKTE